MATPSRHEGDHQFVGDAWFLGDVTLPDGTITADMVASAAGIEATKVVHQFPLRHTQLDGSDVATQTEIIHIAYAAGEVLALEAVCAQAPTSGQTITIDLLKSTGGAAFASMLQSSLVLDSGNTDRVPEAAVISASNTYADGDVLEITVVDGGATTGDQGQGLCVTVWVRENPA